ncbi:steroid 17-alpha-hydroxylase/17,20 lyase-like [Strongylocentrotus purpuratus]|uniref:Cytochrome P450 n=1 Tax=Strongylocentrotus purpuratus TaxID=7668 RepID=A0A7M7NT03_STRPU|nr:steroid 17-alpha-hydroxylase/17,20 lyase-like [Strongylocentrotus purpuratus]
MHLTCTVVKVVMVVGMLMVMTPNSDALSGKTPPGPGLLGSFTQLKRVVSDFFRSRSAAEMISEKEGGLYQLNLGLSKICFINSRGFRDEAFLEKYHLFSDRGVESNKKQLPEELMQWRGTIRDNGAASEEARAFVNSTLKETSYLRTTVETQIEEAIAFFDDELTGAIPSDLVVPKMIFREHVLDVMTRIAFDTAGHRNTISGQWQFQKFFEDVDALSNSVLFQPGFISTVLPNTKVDDYETNLVGVAKYLKERAEEAIYTNRETSLVQRYSDFFLKRESSIAQPEDGWRLMYDFFTAGVNTVPEVITWDIYYLASDLDLQDKIRQEMKNFGTDVTYDDRTSLPRTMSFLTEVHRLRPVATLGIPHAASADGTIGGYAIDKETLIIPNHWAMHNDPADWQSDPQVFDATRFLKLNGNDLTFDSDKARIVTPFSVGPRSCPGQEVAAGPSF